MIYLLPSIYVAATGVIISTLFQGGQVSSPAGLAVYRDHSQGWLSSINDDLLIVLVRNGTSISINESFSSSCCLLNAADGVLYHLVSYFRPKPSSTERSSFTFSDVLLWIPPMRYTPEEVAQDTWPYLFCLRVCDLVQVPETGLHLTQVVPGSAPPPQANSPSWVWPYLFSGNWGSEQLVFVRGL